MNMRVPKAFGAQEGFPGRRRGGQGRAKDKAPPPSGGGVHRKLQGQGGGMPDHLMRIIRQP